MREKMNWAVIGTGTIANEMARALQKTGKNFYGVYSRRREKAEEFALKYGVQKAYESAEEMLSDADVHIVYIATPHNTHMEYIKKALQSGKHVLCEKAITLNREELEEAVKIADEKGLVLAEAMTIYHMPLYSELEKIIKSGILGKVQVLQLNFGSFKQYDMNNRFFNLEMAGGALLDIGVYALSTARLFMDSQPDNVASHVRFAPSGADEQECIMLMNREGQMASITMSLHSKLPKRAVIGCEKGYIEIMEYPRAVSAVIVDAFSGERKEITAGNAEDALGYEAADMEEAVRTGNTAVMRLSNTKDVMSLMTELRHDWGLKYPEERLEKEG